MSSVRVLYAGSGRIPPWLRQALPAERLRSAGPADACASILVVNDHSAGVLNLLERALDLRRAGQPVLVVTALNPLRGIVEAMVTGAGAPGPDLALSDPQMIAALARERPRKRTNLGHGSIDFEYTV